MPVTSRKNEYRGVNAHLHSYYLAYGGWEGFHNKHVGDLGEVFSLALPPGYTVDTEQSLQISGFPPGWDMPTLRTRPDLTVYSTAPATRPATILQMIEPTVIQPLKETIDLDEDDYIPALMIYRLDDSAGLGRPIMRLELLSPSNLQRQGLLEYREKRRAALLAGLRLVELHYFHQLPSPVPNLPAYPGDPRAFPYNITLSDPLPSFMDGVVSTYGFHVDDPIPTLTLPLEGDDTCTINFNDAYHLTFSRIRAYSDRVDYAQPPARIETYSDADRARIEARRRAVLAAHAE